MAAIFAYAGMLIGSIGIFVGFYYFSIDFEFSLRVVTFTTVGIVGILAFIRHTVFYKSDGKRMQWQTDRPEWIFEVGFANLAFGIMGVIATFDSQWNKAQAIVLLGYAIYLIQAAGLHGYNYFSSSTKSVANLMRGCIGTFLYGSMMFFFACNGFLRG